MRDYEDLVKSLRYCAEYDCTTVCPRAGTGNGCISRLKKEAADAIEDLIFLLTASNEVVANRRPKWISVEERLPEEGKNVLVCICADGKYDITRGWYDKKQGFCCWDDAAMESADFTKYWMKMPEPPKEET